MKALILAVVLIVMADFGLNDGAGARATWSAAANLVRGTQADVGGSVFRQ